MRRRGCGCRRAGLGWRCRLSGKSKFREMASTSRLTRTEVVFSESKHHRFGTRNGRQVYLRHRTGSVVPADHRATNRQPPYEDVVSGPVGNLPRSLEFEDSRVQSQWSNKSLAMWFCHVEIGQTTCSGMGGPAPSPFMGRHTGCCQEDVQLTCTKKKSTV